ncbi:FG-GAP repeat domain-containing protein [Streptomyces sp. NPDC003863]
MSRARTSRPHLATAVAIALAVTAGATATATAASATTTGAVTAAAGQSAEQDVLPFPKDAMVANAGPAGFVSSQFSTTPNTYRWTRYADGATTELPAGSYTTSWQTNIVTKVDGTVYTMYDMAGGADPVVIDISVLGDGFSSARGAGSALVATKLNASGGRDVHVISKSQGALVDDTVTGLPTDAVITRLDVDSPGTALVAYSATVDGTARSRVAVVDLTTHRVVEEYDTERVTSRSDIALSATSIAWVERPTDSTATLVTVRRDGTGDPRRVPLGEAGYVMIGLMGDWLTYGPSGGYGSVRPDPRYGLYALSLTTGHTVKLLDDMRNIIVESDGTLMAQGGTLTDGEGLYRIATGEDGAPVTELVASTGEPTALEMVSESVPDKVDLDRAPVLLPFTWTFSRGLVKATLELTHTATGKTVKRPGYSIGDAVKIQWDATYAANGDYTWRMTATPENGIGPAVERTGAFTLTRKAVPHDFDDNGTPDYLVRNDSGQLAGYNTSVPFPEKPLSTSHPLGTGWNIYDRLSAPGDLGGSPAGDIVARDKSGVLWLHQGTGRALAPRVRIGGGWQIYDKLAGGSDLTGDGRPDLVATDKAGDLWLYKGTGNTSAPFAPRVKIGHGWGIYNKIVATGNIAGGPAGDLVARDTAGVLWLYLGKGDGTFAPRTWIGGGWNRYMDLVNVGDTDRDGRPDLSALTSLGGVDVYKGTGNWRAPFKEATWLGSFPTSPGTVF